MRDARNGFPRIKLPAKFGDSLTIFRGNDGHPAGVDLNAMPGRLRPNRNCSRSSLTVANCRGPLASNLPFRVHSAHKAKILEVPKFRPCPYHKQMRSLITRPVLTAILIVIAALMPSSLAAKQASSSATRLRPSSQQKKQTSDTSNPAVTQDQQHKQPDLPPAPNVPLPPTFANPAIPLLIAPPPPTPPLPSSLRPRRLESASEIIKVMLGLVFMFGLAYLAGHQSIQALEEKLHITQVVTAGLPFVFLGVIAHTRAVGILSESVLWELRPLLALGLGWIGFTAGFRFDSKLGQSIIPGTSSVSLLTASAPFLTILGACAALLVYIERSPANTIFLRDAMMLGTAGAMTAYTAPKLLEQRAAGISVDRVSSIVILEQLAGFIGLLLVAAYFRPQDGSVTWQLPGTAWLFITLGMGTTVGALIWGMLSEIKDRP